MYPAHVIELYLDKWGSDYAQQESDGPIFDYVICCDWLAKHYTEFTNHARRVHINPPTITLHISNRYVRDAVKVRFRMFDPNWPSIECTQNERVKDTNHRLGAYRALYGLLTKTLDREFTELRERYNQHQGMWTPLYVWVTIPDEA